jgi:hypothetical protein
MALLTWRDVANPNFGTAMQGTALTAQLLNQAASGLSNGIGQFQGAQEDQAARAVMSQALKYQDPQQYQAALASGALTAGVDPTNLTTGTLDKLNSRTGTLLSNAVAGQGLKQDQYTFGQKQTNDQAIAAAQPDINRALIASAQGDMNQANGILAGSDAVRGLNPQVLNTILQNSSNQMAGNTGNRSSAYSLGKTMLNDAEERQAQEAFQQLERNAVDSGSARTALDSMQLPPAIRGRVETLASSRFGQLYGPLGANDDTTGGLTGISATSPALGAGPKQGWGAVYAGAAQPPKDITNMTVKEAADWGRDVLIPATKGKINNGDLGTSAVGGFQFTHNTLREFAPKVFGKDWENTPMTPENQDKIGQAIFEARKNGNLNETWKALPNSTPGAYKDASWDTVRSSILRGEAGIDLRKDVKAAAVSSNEANLSLGLRASENRAATPADRIAAAASKDVTASQAADDLLKTDLAGSNKGQVLSLVQEVVNRSKVNGVPTLNPQQAAEAVRTSLTGDGGPGIGNAIARFGRKINPLNRSDFGNGTVLDDNALSNTIDMVKKGNLPKTVIANQQAPDLASSISSAKDAYTAANQRLARLRGRTLTGQSTPGILAEIAKQEAVVAAARKDLNDYVQMQQGSSNFRSVATP